MIHHEHHTLDILDIGSTLSNPAALQKQLYTLGLAYQPTAFLGEDPFPYAERRSGVLWVENKDFTRFTNKVHDRVLNDPTYGPELTASLDAHTRTGQRALAQGNLPQLWETLARLMAFTAFNWLIPHDHITKRVMNLTSMDYDSAERWRLRVSIPSVMPHFLTFRLAFLDLVAQLQAGQTISTETFAEKHGPLEGQGLISQIATCSLSHRSPYENPQFVLAEAQRDAAATPSTQVQAERISIVAQRQTILQLRDEAIGVAHLLARLRNEDAALIASIAAILQAAVTSEETRHVLQVRAEARLRDHLLESGKNLASTTAQEMGLPMPPLAPTPQGPAIQRTTEAAC